jgi:ATP-binding protein involved in chromosome partitioning
MASVVPSEIQRIGHEEIHITWADGKKSVLANRALRLECPCAGCVDELSGKKTLDPSTVPDEIWPSTIELVGHYAITITWSDAHDTGIYTFERLRAMTAENSLGDE